MSASDRDPSMELVDYVSAITNQQSTLQQRFDALEEMASVWDTQTQLLNNRKIRISIETYDGDEDEGSESDPASVIATATGATKH